MEWHVDLGFNGGGAGGPWLSWHPQASRDGSRPARTWLLRQADGNENVTNAPNVGFVVDLPAIRTGWERASGRAGMAPARQWNDDPARYKPQPGPDYKQCFSLPVALSKDQRAVWEQASLASRIALEDLRKLLAADPVSHGDELPVVRCTGIRTVNTRAGITEVPVLTLLKWVPRPACLARLADDTGWDGDPGDPGDPGNPGNARFADDPGDPGYPDDTASPASPEPPAFTVDPWNTEAAEEPASPVPPATPEASVSPAERASQVASRSRPRRSSPAKPAASAPSASPAASAAPGDTGKAGDAGFTV